jgi:lysophospholipase L1-like esterase
MNGFQLTRENYRSVAKTIAPLIVLACVFALAGCGGDDSAVSADSLANAKKTWNGANYVAMGDSYTAAPRIPKQTTKQTPAACGQSESNYPHDIQKMIESKSFSDRSCSSATVTNLYTPQRVRGGSNYPQGIDLKADTQLVTLGIGGNDIPLTQLLSYCIKEASPEAPCDPASAVQQAGASFEDAIVALERIFPDVFSGIKQRAPKAVVVLVGYPQILPEGDESCVAKTHISVEGMSYVNEQVQKLNSLLKSQATKNAQHYVDTYGPSKGHDACQEPSKRWVEPIDAQGRADPFHPNKVGQTNFALLVMAELAKIKR